MHIICFFFFLKKIRILKAYNKQTKTGDMEIIIIIILDFGAIIIVIY